MDCNKLLNDNGKFFLQIINYDRIIDNKINFLPLIENNNIRFERYYTYLKTEKLITFSTKLFLKTQKNKLIQNSISLIPLRKNILSNLLKNTGFTISNYFSNFKKTSFQNNSIPLILTATKS
jgi:hypothetical protein